MDTPATPTTKEMFGNNSEDKTCFPSVAIWHCYWCGGVKMRTQIKMSIGNCYSYCYYYYSSSSSSSSFYSSFSFFTITYYYYLHHFLVSFLYHPLPLLSPGGDSGGGCPPGPLHPRPLTPLSDRAGTGALAPRAEAERPAQRRPEKRGALRLSSGRGMGWAGTLKATHWMKHGWNFLAVWGTQKNMTWGWSCGRWSDDFFYFFD